MEAELMLGGTPEEQAERLLLRLALRALLARSVATAINQTERRRRRHADE